jgi:chemotaxis signal transduction protein
LVAVRGELHLCLALIELLQLGLRQELAGERTRLVLLAPDAGLPVAFRANEVIGLRRISSASIEEVPSTLPPALTRCVVGMVPFEQGRLALLDDQAVIALLEQAMFE